MRRWLAALVFAVMAATTMAPMVASAQDDKGTPEVDFQAMDPKDSRHKEDLSGIPFMVGAYMVIWCGLFGYLFLIQKRQGKVEAEIADLRKALEAHDGAAT